VRLAAAAGDTGGPGVSVPPAGWLALAAQDSAGPVVLPGTDSGAVALFPLRVRGIILGFAVWTRLAGSFQETELLIGGQLAAQAALSMHDAYLYRREAATVDVLQRDMLAVQPPDLPGIEIVHRYLPGGPGRRGLVRYHQAARWPGGPDRW
jgi:GAF domain-containing protein